MPDEKLSGEFVLSEKKEEPSTNPARTDNPAEKEVLEKVAKEATIQSAPHFYSAFSHNPKNIKFQDQGVDETVILLLRQHFITNLPWLLGIFLLAFLPIAISFIFPFLFIPIEISPTLITISIAFYYLVLFTFLVLYFSIWYFNVGLVTNKRLIDIDVPNILVRVLSEARLNSVQEVTVVQVGGIRSFFDYGNVDIQTEAVAANIEFHRIPKPNFVRTVIGNLVVHRK